MGDGIYTALSGAIAESSSLDTTAANLANASTDGYQRMRPVFQQALAQAMPGGRATSTVTTSTNRLDTSRGAFRVTGRPLDVTLPDNAYLSVATTRGERFTRAGSLSVGADGTLTARGEPLFSEDGKTIKMTRDQGELKVTPGGEVFQGETRLARLRVVSFPNADQLSPEGNTLLNAGPAAGTPGPAKGDLQIGSVEESNTSVIGAMTDLVTASRTFDAFQRAIDAFHEADQKAAATVPSDQ
jgi:flagellar basal-body rod protein FlgF